MTSQYPSMIFRRLFSTKHQLCARSSDSALAYAHRNVPRYPYPPARTYKQSNFGLYGGSHIQFDNQVSEKFKIKTRRTWSPNIQHKKLWSDALGRFVKVKVQARVLKTIDKVGGLDEYLLGGKPARVKELGMGGWKLRWKIIGTDKVQGRFALEREALGLAEKTAEVRQEEEPVADGKDRRASGGASQKKKGKKNVDRDSLGRKPETPKFMEEHELNRPDVA